MEALMQVEISLFEENGKGPAMWFLGVPPKPKISLNYAVPGPVTVEFDNLSEEEKRHILVSLNMRKIRASVSYADLIRNYAASVEVSPVEQLIKAEESGRDVQSTIEINAAKQTEREKRCASLMALGVKSLKVEVSKLDVNNQEDLLVLKSIAKIERMKPKRRQRASVLTIVDEKLHQYNKEVISEIEKSSKDTRVVDPFRPYDKLEVRYDVQVEESDQEIIRAVIADSSEVKDTKKK